MLSLKGMANAEFENNFKKGLGCLNAFYVKSRGTSLRKGIT